MKSFTERNPYLLGIPALGLVAAIAIGALLLTGGALKSRYTVTTTFPNAAGVSGGTPVKVAGITSGTVTHVRREGTHVAMELKVNHGVKLPHDSTAQVVLSTLLGSKYVQITAGADWSHLLHGGDRIKGTEVPIDLNTLTEKGSKLLGTIDAKVVNHLLNEVDHATSGNVDNLRKVLDGLDKLATVVDQRKGQTAHLLDAARSLVDNLAANRDSITGGIDELNRVLVHLASRRIDLANLLQGTARVTQQVRDLMARNKPGLDDMLTNLHATLQVLSRHQVDVAQTLADIESALRTTKGIIQLGRPPHYVPWANISSNGFGITAAEVGLGPCGVLDKMLDSSLGPDPLPCNQRTGPSPYNVSGQATGSAVVGGGIEAPESSSGRHNPLAALLDPLVTK